jgi:hypothetical protein
MIAIDCRSDQVSKANKRVVSTANRFPLELDSIKNKLYKYERNPKDINN